MQANDHGKPHEDRVEIRAESLKFTNTRNRKSTQSAHPKILTGDEVLARNWELPKNTATILSRRAALRLIVRSALPLINFNLRSGTPFLLKTTVPEGTSENSPLAVTVALKRYASRPLVKASGVATRVVVVACGLTLCFNTGLTDDRKLMEPL
jgi:hypothetical protein